MLCLMGKWAGEVGRGRERPSGQEAVCLQILGPGPCILGFGSCESLFPR